MIGWLKGRIQHIDGSVIVLEVQGVGYEVELACGPTSQMPTVGEEIACYIHMVVREDAMLLFGFLTEHVRHLFRLLIKASGVGPKMALQICSALTISQVIHAILHNEPEHLQRVKGLGPKLAKRLVLELQQPCKQWPYELDHHLPSQQQAELGSQSNAAQEQGSMPSKQILSDAISALVHLGYRPHQTEKLIHNIAKADDTIEALVKRALQAFHQGVDV